MSVMIDTSFGEVVVDLFFEEAPLAAKNFLKLCKIKYYNGCLFYNVQQNFMIQAGDPTATGTGGTSVYGLLYGEQARFFEDEISATSRKHDEAGLLSMANMGVPNSNGSQFFFSMRGDDMQHLDGKHTVFAKVMEGMETLEKINGQFCDDQGRPYRDIRILHTYILDDPFDDPPQLAVPDESPLRERPEEERVALRLGALDEVSLEADERTELEREKQLREKTARSNAVVLEMIGDLPDADMKPPENVLFVCKLNPVTTDDDLEIIFTRFGTCRAEICRDHITGDSLNYAFVEFEAIESCEEAFKKMNNVLIDDRRIRVDFSQSVAKEWSKYKGRAQGGQKLASGKAGKPAQQHQPIYNGSTYAPPAAEGGRGTAVGQQRKSKWGDAPRGGAVAEAAPISARQSHGNGDGRRHDEGASRHGGGGDGQNGRRPEAKESRRGDGETARGGGGRRREEDRREGRGDRRRGGDSGGGDGDGHRDRRRKVDDDEAGGQRREDGSNGNRRSRDVAPVRERREPVEDIDGGGRGGGRRRGGEGDERSRTGSGARSGDRDSQRGGDERDGGGRNTSSRGSVSGSKSNDSHRRGDHRVGESRREERENGDRKGRSRDDERSSRRERSGSRSRERARGRKAGSRDRSGRR